MKIAVGNRRTQKKWVNRDWSWEELVSRCSQTTRTAETVAEYRKVFTPLDL